jgi:hypothetical protein
MNRIVTILAVASVVFATPAFAQGRYGAEAAERKADREYREAVRRAEHPELYEKAAAAKPAEAPAQEAAPAQPVEPSAAAPEPAAPAH